MGEREALGHELTEHDREEAEEERHDDECEGLGGAGKEAQARPFERRLEVRRQVDRGVRRRQEADERQPDLGDRQESAGLTDKVLDPAGAGSAFLDELIDPRPAHRHQRDLGGDEDRLEEREDGDDDQRDDDVH